MAPYALLSIAKSSEEQGVWAATTAVKILDGAKPSDIPITANKKGEIYLNQKIAETLKISFDESLVAKATRVID